MINKPHRLSNTHITSLVAAIFLLLLLVIMKHNYCICIYKRPKRSFDKFYFLFLSPLFWRFRSKQNIPYYYFVCVSISTIVLLWTLVIELNMSRLVLYRIIVSLLLWRKCYTFFQPEVIIVSVQFCSIGINKWRMLVVVV